MTRAPEACAACECGVCVCKPAWRRSAATVEARELCDTKVAAKS